MERPLEVRYRKPEGHAGHGFAAPGAYVLGRNICIRCVPFVPRYDARMVNAPGKSRWIEASHVCADDTRNSGSTAKVVSVASTAGVKPFASVSRFAAVLAMLNAVASGGCTASSDAIG